MVWFLERWQLMLIPFLQLFCAVRLIGNILSWHWQWYRQLWSLADGDDDVADAMMMMMMLLCAGFFLQLLPSIFTMGNNAISASTAIIITTVLGKCCMRLLCYFKFSFLTLCLTNYHVASRKIEWSGEGKDTCAADL